jgi:hypothetical protein
MEMSSVVPSWVRARRTRAARIALAADTPAEMSAMEIPALAGSSRGPVIDRNPASAWISRS